MLSYLLVYICAAIMSQIAPRLSPNKKRPGVVVGTRDSVLALAQTAIVEKFLRGKLGPEFEFGRQAIKTAGDKNQTVALHEMERKSLWTSELEDMLVVHKVDIIVHSLKGLFNPFLTLTFADDEFVDMPTMLPETCSLAAILEREDPRDAFVVRAGHSYRSLSELPHGAIIGSSSVRRMAQVKRLYPHLVLVDCRGNVPSRLRKLDNVENLPQFNYDALILAAAGLLRLGLGDRITEYLDAPEVLHAVGQGAIGIEIRAGDDEVVDILKGLTHEPTALACYAERELLRTLEGGCSVPIGVKTTWDKDGSLHMLARVSSLDGTQNVEADERARVSNQADAEAFGRTVAQKLVVGGCVPILEKIEADKTAKEKAKHAAEAAMAAAIPENDESGQLGESVVLVESEDGGPSA